MYEEEFTDDDNRNIRYFDALYVTAALLDSSTNP